MRPKLSSNAGFGPVSSRVARVLRLLFFVVPLGLDTFALSAAVGMARPSRRQRIQLSVILPAFESAMPVVGLLLGHGLVHLIGRAANYVAAGALAALGAYLLLPERENESNRVNGLTQLNGLALFVLGLSISLDELAMGFTIGLLHLAVARAILLIGIQAVIATQLGLRLGARVASRGREWAERLAGMALLGLAALVLIEQVA